MTNIYALCTLAVFVMVPCLMAQGTGVFARVTSVAGNAVLKAGNGAPGFTLTRGYDLSPGDCVDTTQGARVVIGLSDGSVVIVQPGTILTLRDFRAAVSLRELFEITVGSVRVKIHHLTGQPNPYRMNSPTASIAVRGTEFNVSVANDGDTRVDVYEGAVEVQRLDSPDDRALIEAGRGAIIIRGQALQIVSGAVAQAAPVPPRAEFDENRRGQPQGGSGHPVFDGRPPGGPQSSPKPRATRMPGADEFASPSPTSPQQRASNPAPATAALLLTSPDLPVSLRYLASFDLHLDSYENPASATAARSVETRLSLSGMSPQFSIVAPLTRGFVIGASTARATSTSIGLLQSTAFLPGVQTWSSDTSVSSFSVFGARSLGRTSAGLQVERLAISSGNESGLSGSSPAALAAQTRVTAGISTWLTDATQLTAWTRLGAAMASSGPLAVTDRGHTFEAGVRVRGPVTRKVFYGLTAELNSVRLTSFSSRTVSAGGGLGFALLPGTVLAIDVTAGTLEANRVATPFSSMHGSVQHHFTKRAFASASVVRTFRQDVPGLPLWRTCYAELGAGWHFSPAFTAQYLFMTSSFATHYEHGLGIRYTFGSSKQDRLQ